MKGARDLTKKIMAIAMSFLLIFSMIPTLAIPAFAAGSDTRTVDPSTIDNWERYFGKNTDTVFDTTNAGGIWTDKSVFKDANSLSPVTMDDANENFLVALSALAANKEIKGYSYLPTDTMLVLDLSGSMEGSGSNADDNIEAMVTATNAAIARLQGLNNYNRVGVVLYSGNSNFGSSSTNTATVVLPLDRYTATNNEFFEYDGRTEGSGRNQEYVLNVKVGSTVKNSANTSVSGNKDVVGGTYIQNGIYQAWQEFAEVDDVAIESGVQAGTKRIPIMVLMSDGAPTTATTNYADVGASNAGNGATSCATDEIGFLTQLTAAWTRIQMETKYGTTPKVYTLGLGIDSLENGKQVARSVLDPDNSMNAIDTWWDEYLDGDGAVRMNVHNTSTGSNPGTKSVEVAINTDITAAASKAKDSNGTIKMPQAYVDRYYAANNAAELTEGFEYIVEQIILQSKYYPTEAALGKHDLGGYISFEDAIGEFMEVKDMKGILLGSTLYNGHSFAELITTGALGTTEAPTAMGNEFIWSLMERLDIDIQTARDLIRQAYLAGQISYTNDNTYSNYAGWYADANGKYLGFAPSETVPDGAVYIMKSYGYLGEKANEESIKGSEMMYMTVRVQEEIATGRQTVQWSIPASLIPTITYEVELDNADYTKVNEVKMTRQNANPVRLVYEVGLAEDLNELNVAEFMATQEHVHKDADGNYEFYTNRWGDDNVDGKIDIDYTNPYTHTVTVSDFEPSSENERYYYTEDSKIYVKNGNEYTEVTYDPNSQDGEYYWARRIFRTTGNGNEAEMKTVYEHITDASLAKARKTEGGNSWYIPAGTVQRFIEENVLNKTTNVTETMNYVVYPFIYNATPTTDEGYHADTFLGNNGKMTITPATGIKLTKTIDVVEPGTSTTFNFLVTLTNADGSDVNGTFEGTRIAANGTESTFNVEVTSGKANITISDGETVYITGLADGMKYKVEEVVSDNSDYIVKSVNGSTAATYAEGTIENQTLEAVDFVNTLRKHNNLIVNKVVTHPFGDNYEVPDTIEFTVVVELTAPTGVVLADAYEIKIGNTSQNYNVVDGKLTFKIKGGETASIHNIEEGITYKVSEVELPNGFILDTENSTVLNGVISLDATSAVTLVNDYNPTNVEEVDVNLTGEKNLTGRVWKESDSFQFALQRFDGSNWVNVATKTVTKDSKKFEFSEEIQNQVYANIGVYQYRVIELGDSHSGITYDKTVRYFDITVTDKDWDGKLEIQPPTDVNDKATYAVKETSPTVVTFSGGEYHVVTDFNNVYAPNTATFFDVDIQKELKNETGVEVGLNGFEFDLYYAKDVTVNADKTFEIKAGATPVISSEATNAIGQTYIRVVYEAADFTKNDGNATVVRDVEPNGNIVKKTYDYVLVEKAGNEKGMTYDDKAKTITVEVVDNLDGTLGAKIVAIDGVTPAEASNETEVTFTNEYDLGSVSLGLGLSKKLTGRDAVADEFSFGLYEADESFGVVGNPIQTIKNKASNDGEEASVNFANLTYTKVGTYRYIVREVIPQGIEHNGITYDVNEYKVIVTVTADGNGGLTATKVIENAAGDEIEKILFNNVYTAAGTTEDFQGRKILTVNNGTRTLKAGEFTFALYETDDDYVVEAGQAALQTKSNTSTGIFAFDPIAYNAAGTKYYVIKEVIPEDANKLGGIGYDESSIKIRVEITDDGQGKLSTKTYVNEVLEAPITFTNTYSATEVEVTIGGTKVLEGRELKANEFTFQLLDAAGNVLQTKTNAADGSFNFDKIGYTNVGVYEYTVKELIPAEANRLGGVAYDTTEYKVVVTVTDNGSGKLVATTTVDGSSTKAIQFTNEYGAKEANATIVATKELTGRALKAGEFWFDLYENGKVIDSKANTDAATGNVVFDTITYTKATEEGEPHVYTVVERNTKVDGVTYDDTVYTVEVTVTDDGNGQLVVTQVMKKDNANVDGIKFVNSDPVDAEVVIEGTKTLTGRFIEAGEFRFQLFEGTAKLAEASVTADGTFEFPKMTYNEAGTYTYTVKEVLPEAGKTEYTETGLTYDDTVYTVVVTVTENNGVLVPSYTVNSVAKTEAELAEAIKFENEYTPNPTTAIIDTVSKALTGRDLVRGEFEFKLTLVKVDGVAPAVATEYLAKNGMVYHNGQFVEAGHVYELEFNLHFTEKGTYEFVMEEVNAGQVIDGVTYDTAKFEVVIEVEDKGNGKLEVIDIAVQKDNGTEDDSFRNTYDAADVTVRLAGHKHLEGKALENQQFEFKLYDESGKEVASAKNGNVEGATLKDFELFLTFTEVGEYKYTLKEVDAGKKIAGITYDDVEYEVVVKVTDDGKGQLVAETTINGSKTTPIEFQNKYSVDPLTVDAVVGVNKVLTGRDMEAGEFTFQLKDGNEVVAEGKNEAAKAGEAAKVVFDKLTFEAAGTYIYTLTEVEGQASGVSYSKDISGVIVEVVDNGDGTLSVESVKYENVQGAQTEGVTFTNNYYYTGVKLDKLLAVNGGNPTKETVEAKAGDIITYYFTVTNSGNVPAYDIEIVDKVPAGLEIVDGSIDNNGILASDGTIKWTAEKVDGVNADGEPGTFTVSFKVKVPEVRVDTTWKNVGTVTYTDPSNNPEDPDDPDNPKKEEPSNPVEFTEEAVVPMPPVTGDMTNMALWTAIMALAATGFIGLALKKKEE